MFPIVKPIDLRRSVARRSTPGQNRDRIARAALAVMLEMGAAELSIPAICEKAGISRATLYRSYSSLEEIVQGTATAVLTKLRSDIKQAISEQPKPEYRVDVICDLLAGQDALSVASILGESHEHVLIRIGRAVQEDATAILIDALQPVFDLSMATLDIDIRKDLIGAIVARLHVSIFTTPWNIRDISAADMLKYVLRCLLVRPFNQI